MAICVYDNPATMARECWQDGHLLCAYSMQLFFLKTPIPAKHYFFGANVGPWKTGQMHGEASAMQTTNNA
jgi:hypothetical protein